jgi:hypothetical protein
MCSQIKYVEVIHITNSSPLYIKKEDMHIKEAGYRAQYHTAYIRLRNVRTRAISKRLVPHKHKEKEQNNSNKNEIMASGSTKMLDS